MGSESISKNVVNVTAAALASSMIQAMDSTKHECKMVLTPPPPNKQTNKKGTQTNDKCDPQLTPNVKTGGM